MPVSSETWVRGMLDLALLPSREEDAAMLDRRAEVYQRELQPYLTDHEWRHAVSEALRGGEWFPTIYALADWAKSAPPPEVPQRPMLTGGFGCDLCDGTGFEPFERSGYKFVRNCPRGCKPYRDKDGPRGDPRAEEWSAKSSPSEFNPGSRRGAGRRQEPFPNAVGIMAKLQAICREHYAVGQKQFAYPGIEDDIAAEEAAAKEARCRG